MKWHKFLSLIFTLIFYLPTEAQSTYNWGGLGYASVGFQSISFKNEDLKFQNTSVFRENMNFQFGGGGFLLLGSKYVFMGHGYGSVYSKESLSNVDVTPTYGGGGINFGYAVFNQSKLLIFPTIGLGGAGYRLEVENKSQTGLNFGSRSILDNESGRFELGNAYIDFNLNIHKLISIGEDSDGEQGVSLGFTFGYQISLNEGNWNDLIGNTEVIGPDRNSTGVFYLRFLVGGGGFNF